jgi:hypothetical protein
VHHKVTHCKWTNKYGRELASGTFVFMISRRKNKLTAGKKRKWVGDLDDFDNAEDVEKGVENHEDIDEFDYFTLDYKNVTDSRIGRLGDSAFSEDVYHRSIAEEIIPDHHHHYPPPQQQQQQHQPKGRVVTDLTVDDDDETTGPPVVVSIARPTMTTRTEIRQKIKSTKLAESERPQKPQESAKQPNASNVPLTSNASLPVALSALRLGKPLWKVVCNPICFEKTCIACRTTQFSQFLESGLAREITEDMVRRMQRVSNVHRRDEIHKTVTALSLLHKAEMYELYKHLISGRKKSPSRPTIAGAVMHVLLSSSKENSLYAWGLFHSILFALEEGSRDIVTKVLRVLANRDKSQVEFLCKNLGETSLQYDVVSGGTDLWSSIARVRIRVAEALSRPKPRHVFDCGNFLCDICPHVGVQNNVQNSSRSEFRTVCFFPRTAGRPKFRRDSNCGNPFCSTCPTESKGSSKSSKSSKGNSKNKPKDKCDEYLCGICFFPEFLEWSTKRRNDQILIAVSLFGEGDKSEIYTPTVRNLVTRFRINGRNAAFRMADLLEALNCDYHYHLCFAVYIMIAFVGRTTL